MRPFFCGGLTSKTAHSPHNEPGDNVAGFCGCWFPGGRPNVGRCDEGVTGMIWRGADVSGCLSCLPAAGWAALADCVPETRCFAPCRRFRCFLFCETGVGACHSAD